MKEIEAAVDPEPSLEKIGCGGSRREFRIRGGHVLRVIARPIEEVVSAFADSPQFGLVDVGSRQAPDEQEIPKTGKKKSVVEDRKKYPQPPYPKPK